jgi:hypothetical protein
VGAAHALSEPNEAASLPPRGAGRSACCSPPVTRGRKWVSASYALVRGHCSNPVTDLYPVDGSRRRLAGQCGRRALLRHPQRELGGRWASVEQARLAVCSWIAFYNHAAALRHRLPQPHRLREDHRTPAAGRRMKPGVHPWGNPNVRADQRPAASFFGALMVRHELQVGGTAGRRRRDASARARPATPAPARWACTRAPSRPAPGWPAGTSGAWPAPAGSPIVTAGDGVAAHRRREEFPGINRALHDRGCSCGLNPPVSSSDLAMYFARLRKPRAEPWRCSRRPLIASVGPLGRPTRLADQDVSEPAGVLVVAPIDD